MVTFFLYRSQIHQLLNEKLVSFPPLLLLPHPPIPTTVSTCAGTSAGSLVVSRSYGYVCLERSLILALSSLGPWP